jgi:non-canonical (house-cleaning) NTP pyrophosphatase
MMKNPQADFGVGLEAGRQYWPKMEVPTPIVKRILDGGKTLGQVTDEMFKVQDCGQSQGYFGLMTNGSITRSQAYRDAVIFALTYFLHPEVF